MMNIQHRLPPGFTQLTHLVNLSLNDVSLTNLPHDIGALVYLV